MQKLTLGYSPCPNDTFIFDAMVHHKIDTEGLDFEVTLADVEELNQKAFKQELDITKLSYHAFGSLTNEYILMNSGSALGSGVGPLLIAKKEYSAAEVDQLKISIPGKFTTANFLLSIAFPNATNKVEMLFSDIEQAVIDGKVDAGLIIHENRFTYHQRGLHKIMDMGAFWEAKTNALIPLGGIVLRRTFDEALQQKLDRVLRRSIEFAFANLESCMDYVRANAQEMEEEVMKKHIELYVNEYSVDLGEKGRYAVESLFNLAVHKEIIAEVHPQIFIKSKPLT
ncbi:1,4-dihydroxy-6-naphthoate synthase [Vicingaceae bacterium]|nr:1,4-dihydroxy-6-naphthoate synthase [Vicingaceae bacterium]